MKPEEYKTLYELESDYWYFVALRNLISHSFKDKFKNALEILDAGCGTGALLENFANRGHMFGIDISGDALNYCKKRNLHNVAQATISDLPFKDNRFDLITSIDVICCLDENDELKAFREIHRVLKTDGTLILNLPAYKFLMSEHDKATHTKKRYSRAELKKKLELAGFKIHRITYRNTLLFPFIMIYRILKKNSKSAEDSESDLRAIPSFLNKSLIALLTLENSALSKINSPFGNSVFCIAHKYNNQPE